MPALQAAVETFLSHEAARDITQKGQRTATRLEELITSFGAVKGDKAEAERVFNSLSDGGNVIMPFEQTFWSPGFGMCTDRFGTPWMVNTDSEQP